MTTRGRREVRAGLSVIVILVVLTLAGASRADAAPGPTASCSWSPAQVAVAGDLAMVTAINLPTNDTFGFTFELYPVGTTRTTEDGTFSFTTSVNGPLTAYFWQRGGGKSLIRMPKQLGDYKVIAYCSVGVT